MLSEDELERYARQIMLFGEDGQKKLKRAKVFIAGVGGLGCPVALYLAVAGIGSIKLVDKDVVDSSNLNRQVLHWEEDVGKEKVVSAEEKLRAINSDILIEAIYTTIDESNVSDLVGDADLIVDAMDNYSVRYLLNIVAHKKKIPLFHGAISGFDGQLTTIIPGETACMNCIFPSPPDNAVFPVVGVTAGVVAMMQANEVIKYLLGIGKLLTNKLLIWDGLFTEAESLRLSKRDDCIVCGCKSESNTLE